jgi:hypothetical protein
MSGIVRCSAMEEVTSLLAKAGMYTNEFSTPRMITAAVYRAFAFREMHRHLFRRYLQETEHIYMRSRSSLASASRLFLEEQVGRHFLRGLARYPLGEELPL